MAASTLSKSVDLSIGRCAVTRLSKSYPETYALPGSTSTLSLLLSPPCPRENTPELLA